jgi:hypothetical protein
MAANLLRDRETRHARQASLSRKNRLTRHFCASRPFFLIILLPAGSFPMLSCNVGGIFPQRQNLSPPAPRNCDMAHKTSSKTGSTRRTSVKSLKKSDSSRSAKSRKTKGNSATAVSAGDKEVSIDRRRGSRRDEANASESPAAGTPQLERRKKVNRRRQIDPTTCERDYTDQEVEFMNALDDYKRRSGRMFPTCSEVLEVVRGLGYVKLSPAELGAVPAEITSASSAKPMPNELSAMAQEADDDSAVSDSHDIEAAW